MIKIKFLDYLKLSLIFLLGLGVIAVLILSVIGTKIDRIGAAIGLLISYGNTLLGYAIISKSYSRPINEFMALFYGGMIFRFLLIFSILFVLIVGLKLPMIAVLSSLCFSYFVFLGLEIYVVQKFAEKDRT